MVQPNLAEIGEAASNSDTEKLYKLIHQLVPEYKPIYKDIDNL